MSKRFYLLTDEDFEKLNMLIDRDPRHGYQGGGSVVLSDVEEKAHDSAHRFFNYQVRGWIREMRD